MPCTPLHDAYSGHAAVGHHEVLARGTSVLAPNNAHTIAAGGELPWTVVQKEGIAHISTKWSLKASTGSASAVKRYSSHCLGLTFEARAYEFPILSEDLQPLVVGITDDQIACFVNSYARRLVELARATALLAKRCHKYSFHREHLHTVVLTVGDGKAAAFGDGNILRIREFAFCVTFAAEGANKCTIELDDLDTVVIHICDRDVAWVANAKEKVRLEQQKEGYSCFELWD
jgi:hypothetical protein